MTNHEGDISSNTSQAKLPMQPSHDPNEIFELASVHTAQYECAVDAAISSCYKAEPQDTSRYDTDAAFASCLNSKVEKAKFGATIGSTTTSDKDCCLFLGQHDLNLTSEELEESISTILDDNQINAVIKDVEAYRSKGADAKSLSKLWMVNDELVHGALYQNK